MKRILLASTAIVAFSGAAFAEGHTGVTFSGTANLGYNDTTVGFPGFNIDVGPAVPTTVFEGEDEGFYSEIEIEIGLAAELDNGLTVAASIDLGDLADGAVNESPDAGDIDYELSLKSETAGLYYGDTNFAAQNIWVSAGDMEGDNFSEADGEEALRAEMTYGDIEVQLSYVLSNNAGTRVDNIINDKLDQLSVGVSADFGNINVVAAYQAASDVIANGYNSADIDGDGIPDPLFLAGTDTRITGDNGDFVNDEVFGISVGTSFSGADLRLAYAQNENDDSIGVQVAYPFGPVTATVYYVVESSDTGNDDDNYGFTVAYEEGPLGATFDYDNDQGTDKYGLEGSYDLGNGLTAFAGYLFVEGLSNPSGNSEESAFYVAGTYDLGSGAELLMSFAEGNNDEYEDEIGAGDYQDGTTVQVSFEF